MLLLANDFTGVYVTSVASSSLLTLYRRYRLRLGAWFDAPPHYRPWPLLNQAGLQVMRAIFANARHALRPRLQNAHLRTLEQALDRDGIIAIPDFLPPEAFAEVQRACREFAQGGTIKVEHDKGGTGVDWYTGRIDPGKERSDAERILTRHISRNPTLKTLAQYVLRRRISTDPTLSYQRLVLRVGMRDNTDVEGVLHADRHYPCVKIAYYIGNNTREAGAYIFCRGSHKMNRARLRHEYEYSIRQGRYLKGERDSLDPTLLERGRNRVADAMRASMGLMEDDIIGAANTLVVSNNAGFHKRGTITPGHEREQIRILFYYVQRPWYSRLLLRLASRGAQL